MATLSDIESRIILFMVTLYNLKYVEKIYVKDAPIVKVMHYVSRFFRDYAVNWVDSLSRYNVIRKQQ